MFGPDSLYNVFLFGSGTVAWTSSVAQMECSPEALLILSRISNYISLYCNRTMEEPAFPDRLTMARSTQLVRAAALIDVSQFSYSSNFRTGVEGLV